MNCFAVDGNPVSIFSPSLPYYLAYEYNFCSKFLSSKQPILSTIYPITMRYQNNRYGEERYEKRDLQLRVRQRFDELEKLDKAEGRVSWHVVSAAQSIEQVQADINSIVEKILEQVYNGKALGKLWEEGDYQMTTVNSKNDTEKENAEE